MRVVSILLHRKQHPGYSLLIVAWRAQRHSRWSGTWDPWNAAIYLSRRHERTGRGTGEPPGQPGRLARQVPQAPPGLGSGSVSGLALALALVFVMALEEEGVVAAAAELVLVQQEGRLRIVVCRIVSMLLENGIDGNIE